MCFLASALLMVASQSNMPPLEKEAARDEQLLLGHGLKTDGPALLQFLRGRTLAEGDRAQVRALIQQLGSPSFRQRDLATKELIARGTVAIEALRQAAQETTDLEILRRIDLCLQRIQAKDVAVDVPAAVVRVLVRRRPPGAAATLLNFLPFADNDLVIEEVRKALIVLAVKDGKLDPGLAAGLSAGDPIRRAGAAEAILRSSAASAQDKIAARKLLKDEHPVVRWRVATALAFNKERDAVPILINLLPQLTQVHAWQIEDLLFRLAEDRQPPGVVLGSDDASRKKCRDAWAAWWKEHGPRVEMARLTEIPPMLGYTMIVLLDQGQVLELGPKNQIRWQIHNLIFPLDAQFLAGKDFGKAEDYVLVAEYHGGRVTERNLKGEVVWEKRLGGALAAQRLVNGNTFVVTDSQMYEYDKDGKEVLAVSLPDGERVMKGAKLANGDIACLTTNARVVRLDARGKVLHSFAIPLGMKLFGGRIHMLANGRVIIPHNAENKVSEYDTSGKEVWSVAIDQPVAATRLPNGHTLVTTMLPHRGAVEFDRHGKEVWSYNTNTRVTRALRR